MTRRHGSMFSGIGGFELGFEMAGIDTETVWQSEIDPYCVRLLERRFPGARQVGDITAVTSFEPVDVLTAGFPCQPVSDAGQKKAQDDERWLWPEVRRVIGLIRPPLVIIENVRGLRSRGLHEVLVDLAALGYDAQWDLIPAAAVGAPHLRRRFLIVAYPAGTPMGHVFDGAPPVFAWPDEEPCKPRLLAKAPHRRARLTGLGNGVVPHLVCYVTLAIERARSQGVLQAPSLFGMPLMQLDHRKPPPAGMLLDGTLHETVPCAPKMRGVRLWPTAAAEDAEWSLEALQACVHADGTPARDPHMRFYHPGTGQIVQRGLYNYVLGAEAGLWPTPNAADGNGKGARSNAGVQEDGSWRTRNLVDAVVEAELYPTPLAADADGSRGSKGAARPGEGGLAKAAGVRDEVELLPTPVVSDRAGSRRSTARTDSWTSNEGESLTDKAWELEDGAEALWPTAAASDHKGVSQPGQRRGQLEEAVKEAEGLWPTPNAADALGGRTTGGSREGGLPLAAAVHEQEALWETPLAAPWSHGGAGGVLQAQVKEVQGEEIGGWSRDGATPKNPGRSLNPRWVEWLMGVPPEWTNIDHPIPVGNSGDGETGPASPRSGDQDVREPAVPEDVPETEVQERPS